MERFALACFLTATLGLGARAADKGYVDYDNGPQLYRYVEVSAGAYAAIPIRAVYDGSGFQNFEDGEGYRRYTNPPRPSFYDGLARSMAQSYAQEFRPRFHTDPPPRPEPQAPTRLEWPPRKPVKPEVIVNPFFKPRAEKPAAETK